MVFSSNGQIRYNGGKTENKEWYLNGYFGISAGKAYAYVKSRKPSPVIVAVIDVGVNINHQALKESIWVNPQEINRNGIDDDHNGYIDDVHGWNFIGSKDGQTVLTRDTYSYERLYYKYKNHFERLIDPRMLNHDSLYLYKLWNEAKYIFQEQVTAKKALLRSYMEMIVADDIIRSKLNTELYSKEWILNIGLSDSLIMWARDALLQQKISSLVHHRDNKELIENSLLICRGLLNDLKKMQEPPEDNRGKIVRDQYDNFADRYYGNNLVGKSEPYVSHGSHVAGIIKAINSREGISGNDCVVQLMALRVVPASGDEHDKDVALAIRYAVDNGAKVINMSFGKSCSAEKYWVDDAVKYAEEHNVLLVHAAGNEGLNIDSVHIYPNQYYQNHTARKAQNWINVGASGMIKKELVPGFTNYGKQNVDVFAPGVSIYSCSNLDTQFVEQSGTSMAAPVVSGIAAFIWSYYPMLSSSQVKYIIERSTNKYTILVNPPHSSSVVPFSNLSVSGGIVNAYNAIRLADELNDQSPFSHNSYK